MELKATIINKPGETENIIYRDIESEKDFNNNKIRGCRAYCFYKDKLVVVYEESKDRWSVPGGGVEDEEQVRDAVVREVMEEANMKVLKQQFIGLMEVVGPGRTDFYTASVC